MIKTCVRHTGQSRDIMQCKQCHFSLLSKSQTAQKSGKRSLAAAAMSNRLRAATAPEGGRGSANDETNLTVYFVYCIPALASCNNIRYTAPHHSRPAWMVLSRVQKQRATLTLILPLTACAHLFPPICAGSGDDQTIDLAQAMAAASAANDGAGGGSTISPSLLTLDAGTAFEKGVRSHIIHPASATIKAAQISSLLLIYP